MITLVILGRPNVGKSTLFNRLFGRKRALVHDEPGVTRDRLEGDATWWYQGRPYRVRLVDTGGIGGARFDQEIREQASLALEEADIALCVFDAQTGLVHQDRDLLQELQRGGLPKKIPLIGVVNKVDAETHEQLGAEFFGLPLLEQTVTVSAEHGRGIDDLQALVIETVRARSPEALVANEEELAGAPRAESSREPGEPDEESPDNDEPRAPRLPRIAIVGKPNVGKSTLLNRLVGSNRMITSPIAGTTVDAVDTLVEIGGREFVLVDTAGIRRKSKTEEGIEVLSVVQTKKALDRTQIAILVIDGIEGPSDQDEKIGGLIEEAGCSVVICVNKWDAVAPTGFRKDDAAERIRGQMAYLKYAPIVFISALRGEGIDRLADLFEEMLQQRAVKLATHEFTEWVRAESGVHNPKNARFYMCHQSGRHPPTFVCHVNDPRKIPFSLKRHLVNGIRARWGYLGSPIRMVFIQGKS